MARLLAFFFFISISFVWLSVLSSCEKKEEKKAPTSQSHVQDLQEKIHKAITTTSASVVKIVSSEKGKVDIFKDISTASISSGFVVDKDEKYLYIITAAHGLEDKNPKVVFKGNITKESYIIGKDKASDVALLRVELDSQIKDIKPLKPYLGKLKTGYFVLAAGSPYNLSTTYTFGIISALHRNFGLSAYEDYIQTDASMNPGDSGGPLLDINGNVIGMNSVILESGEGLGFALPIKTVLGIYKDLKKYGYVKRGWLGVLVQSVSSGKGVVVIRVFKNSPAEKAGLQVGDIIVSINGKEIKNPTQLSLLLQKLKPEEVITVNILRNKKLKTFKIKVEEKVKG